MKYILSVLVLLFLTACSVHYGEGDYFYISRAEADMPVWVRGNTDSGVFIIVNHGGPGGTSMYVSNFHSLQELEKDYAMVYWDQRNSGISQGNADPSSLNPGSFVQDLKMVTDSIEVLYNPDSLFLYGVSWGGTLITQYAVTEDYEDSVDGFIVEAGGHNMPLLMSTSISRLETFAQSQIDSGVETDYWQEALTFFSENSDSSLWGVEQFSQYARYLNRTNFDRTYDTLRLPEEYAGPGAEDIMLSPLSFAMFFNPASLLPHMNILNLDLSVQMADISSPVLLLWGEHDFNSPAPELPLDAAASLSNETYEGPIEKAGHNPFIDNPVEFLRRFRNFVEANKGGV